MRWRCAVRHVPTLLLIACAKNASPPPAPEPAATAGAEPYRLTGDVPACEDACARASRLLFGPTPHRSDDGAQPTPDERASAHRALADLCKGGDVGACAIAGAVQPVAGADPARFEVRFARPKIDLTRVECALTDGSWLPLEHLVQPLTYFRERLHDACEPGGWVELGAADQPKTIELSIDFSESATSRQLQSVRGVDSDAFRQCATDQWGSVKAAVHGRCTAIYAL